MTNDNESDLSARLVRGLKSANQLIEYGGNIVNQCLDDDLFGEAFGKRRELYEQNRARFYNMIINYKEASEIIKAKLDREGFAEKTVEEMIKKFEALK